MNFQPWLEAVNGEYIEVAGSANAKNQCVDLANDYIKRVLNLPIIEWTNAIDFPKKAGNKYDWVLNTPTNIPPEGALMIFNIGAVGHISVFIEGNLSLFRSMDQNYPLYTPCHVVQHNYSKVVGWLIPKSAIIDDMTDDQSRALKIIEEYKVKANHGNLEGAANAAVSAAKEIGDIKSSLSDKQTLLITCQTNLSTANNKTGWELIGDGIAKLLIKKEDGKN
jgi:hypothetical protein